MIYTSRPDMLGLNANLSYITPLMVVYSVLLKKHGRELVLGSKLEGYTAADGFRLIDVACSCQPAVVAHRYLGTYIGDFYKRIQKVNPLTLPGAVTYGPFSPYIKMQPCHPECELRTSQKQTECPQVLQVCEVGVFGTDDLDETRIPPHAHLSR